MAIQGVIFDLDGVITDTAHLHFLAWKALGDSLGVEITLELNERLKGLGRQETLTLILKESGLYDKYTETERQALADRKNRAYVASLENLTPQDLLPGIGDCLKDLKKRDIKIGLASSSQNASLIIKKLGLEPYFEAMVDPRSLIKGKPDPEIYLKAAAALGLSPAKCAGVEDARAGLEAIRAAGMTAIALGQSLEQVPADYHLSSTRDLAKVNWDDIVSKE
ncbi:beta-phosphoglucomutase [Abiotrophia sp. HMSC24B09]|uniref:beta-phosphoglucomutase n=1 Tax=Abiotrophia sp. HMSC24B09 TaxID=1581061 RepID=UPI0025B8387D|nr:beta-phosphoglucomutase [Abiotrophia sp. HMSC24B09]